MYLKMLCYLFFFSAIMANASTSKIKTVTKNQIRYIEKNNIIEYNKEYELMRKYFLNKLSLVRGDYLEFKSPDKESTLFLWQEAIDHFIEKRFKDSLNRINLILEYDDSQYKVVCGLLIINNLFINSVSNLENELETCKNLNEEYNTFSHFFLEALINNKLNKSKDETDRFFYENAQDFSTNSDVKAYLKLAIVLGEHKKIINLLSNLPPTAYESKEIRELLAFIFFRLGNNKKVKNYLKNIKTSNSNNLLATLLIKEKKWDLAFARLLVSLQISPFTETTLDRLIPLTIKLKKFKKGINYLNSKKYFLESFNNEVSEQDYELLYIFYNIKNQNNHAAFNKILSIDKKLNKNISDITLYMASYLASILNRRVDEEDFLFRSCKRKNILSCYFLQTLGYFNGLQYFINEFNSNKLSTSIDIDSLKSGTVFSPITERVHINQKYIEELDSY